MKLDYRTLVSANKSLNALLSLSPPPLARTAVKIARNARRIQGHLDDFEKARVDILSAHNIEEDADAVNEEFSALLDVEVDIDIDALTIEEIEESEQRREGFVLPAMILFDCAFMFDLDG